MNRTLVAVVAAAVLLAGTAMATGAFTDGDEVAPDRDSGVYLAPADTANGDQYVDYDERGRLHIRLSPVLPNGQTRVDNLFVVGFAGYDGNDSAVAIELDSEPETLRMYRMDTGAQVAGDAVSLQPGESVRFGLSVTPAERNFTGTISLTVPVPEQQSTEASEDGGSTGGGSGIPPGSDTRNRGDSATPTPTPTTTPESDDPSGGAAVGPGNVTEAPPGGGGTAVGTAAAEPTEPATGTEPAAGGGAEPVVTTPENQQSAEQSANPLGFQPPFGIGWGPWALVVGLLAVATNYLVQTRYHDVLPVLRTHPNARSRRVRSVAVREAAVGLAGIALTVFVVAAVSSTGAGPVAQLATGLGASTLVGTVTGHQLVPKLDGEGEV
ncbi:TafF family fimbrial protein [Haloarcula brevis]|uniref:hypothetical protein n=1 Tax=Haloarcula brevis TaxID=3111453 RepID=UPI00300F21A3